MSESRSGLEPPRELEGSKRPGIVGTWNWHYELVLPGEGGTIKVRHVNRRPNPAEITQGSQQIGTIRTILKPAAQTRFARAAAVLRLGVSPTFVVHDYAGRDTARVHFAEKRGRLVDLVVEVDHGTPEPLRRVALGASLIAGNEVVDWAGGGGGGGG